MDWEGLGFVEVPASGAAGAVASTGWLVPVIGAAISGVTLAIQLWRNRKGPKQKVWSSRIADEVSSLMLDNLNAWYRSNKTRSEQRQALENFDLLWREFVSETAGNPDMGEPGRRAVAERERGGKYDWFAMFRDPIANDPDVQEDYLLREPIAGKQLAVVEKPMGGYEINKALIVAVGAALLGYLAFTDR